MAKTAMIKRTQTREAGVFKKRIGNTTYRVGVHFNNASRETMDEKIMRLIRNETAGEKAVSHENE